MARNVRVPFPLAQVPDLALRFSEPPRANFPHHRPVRPEASLMFKSIGIVLGSYALSIILVLCADPLLTRIFPGDFERGRVPSSAALLASTAFFVVISILCAWVC